MKFKRKKKSDTMQNVEKKTPKLIQTSTSSNQRHRLANFARHLDRGIRREMHGFGENIWPDTYILGLIPVHGFRLRKRCSSEKITWWIEHDIPPYDRYRCEAYQVELRLIKPDQPRLVVRSGISTYPVITMSVEEFKKTLVRAGADKPMFIHRQFGPALDP